MAAGYWGGYFHDLGIMGAVQVAIFASVGAFLHTYLGSKIATQLGVEIGAPTAELATTAAIAGPSLAYGALVMKGVIKDTDAANVFGNMFGGFIVWETANLVETIVTLMEGGDFTLPEMPSIPGM